MFVRLRKLCCRRHLTMLYVFIVYVFVTFFITTIANLCISWCFSCLTQQYSVSFLLLPIRQQASGVQTCTGSSLFWCVRRCVLLKSAWASEVSFCIQNRLVSWCCHKFLGVAFPGWPSTVLVPFVKRYYFRQRAHDFLSYIFRFYTLPQACWYRCCVYLIVRLLIWLLIRILIWLLIWRIDWLMNG